MNALRCPGDDYTTVMSFCVRNANTWNMVYVYHSWPALQERSNTWNEIPWRYLSDQTSVKTTWTKKCFCEICGHGITNSSSAVLADKIATSANVKASYEVFSGMTSAPVINTLMEMVILPKWKVLILFTSNYLLRHILSQGVQGKTGVEGVSGPEVSFAPPWNA